MQTLLSHYRIIEQIGAEGIGVVYAAHDVLEEGKHPLLVVAFLRREYGYAGIATRPALR